ncbi:MAG: pyridoxal-phosphate-dependent aminotransferase family protein [Acetivibrionales bacterium]|jgi:aspartate aminotransferase-like enzyme
MKLFTVGPVEMFPETLNIAGKQLPYFRTQDFSDMMLEADSLLHRLTFAPSYAKTIYLTASGTGAMEATIINCFNENDKLLIVSGGTFGHRFVQICQAHRIPFTEIKLSINENLTEELLEKYDGKGYTGFIVNIHETSIGKLYPIDLISDFCIRNRLYLVVDAISSVFADEFNIEKSNIDAAIFSSQKALALSPGISFIIVSPRIINERIKSNHKKTIYFDFNDYLLNFERGQTPFTPAVGIMLEFANMMKYIDSVGLENKINKTHALAEYFRNAATGFGFNIPRYTMSNSLTPVFFEKDANKIYQGLGSNYGYVVNPSGGKLADKLLRIGHMGNLNENNMEDLLSAMIEIREKL